MIYDACIIGGGIGGLATALSLQQAGFKVLLIERDLHLEDRKQGYGLTLTNSQTGPLAKLGLLEECISKNCPSHCHFIFHPITGDILSYYGRALQEEKGVAVVGGEGGGGGGKEQGGSRGNLRIPRQEMRLMMISRLEEQSIQWGMKFLHYEETENYVKIFLQKMKKSIFPEEEVQVQVQEEGQYLQDDREKLNFLSLGEKQKEDDDDDDDEVIIKAHILIGGDGLRSKIRHLYDPFSSLHFLNITVIIGISSIYDPLLIKKGYYVMDGQQRLFTMPFLPCFPQESTNSNNNDDNNDRPLIMWQLSFAGLSEEEAIALRQSSIESILENALDRTKSWFPAVHNLIRATLPGEIWATPLYDRDPMNVTAIHNKNNTNGSSSSSSSPSLGRVTVVGDACHPMSMFKGQGANQALEDAPALTAHLMKALERHHKKEMKVKESSKIMPPNKRKRCDPNSDDIDDSKHMGNSEESQPSQNPHVVQSEDNGCLLADLPLRSLSSALRTFEREMVARTSKKVLASREAAGYLHSSAIFDQLPECRAGKNRENGHELIWTISGVEQSNYDRFLQILRHRSINALTAADCLEEKLVEVKTHFEEYCKDMTMTVEESSRST
eukprot:gene5536-6099_t